MDELENSPSGEVVEQEVGTPIPGENKPTSVYESTAREMGWRPKEEWEGDPEKWRDAKEFVERGELYDKIDSMGKELKETRKALKMLQEHNAKIKETEYKRAVDELKALQKKHLEEGNSDGYLETTELLTDLKAEQKAREVVKETVPETPQVDPRFSAWVEKNKWYSSDEDMRDYADYVGQRYAKRNPGINPVDVLRYVTQEVKEKFKDKFENPNRTKQSVESGGTPSPVKKSSFELTEDEKKVMNTFIRSGAMSKEEYIEQLKSIRGVKQYGY